MKLWQIAALVVSGLIVGEAKPGALADTFRFATFNVLLPAIIFEAAWDLRLAVMRRNWLPIVLLAVPGVAITGAIIASAAYFGAGLALGAAALLGAVLAATDPVAVTAIFRKLDVPEDLSTIVESESLLNDAIAVVLYAEVIAGVTAVNGGGSAFASLAINGIAGALIGVLVGGALGYAGSFSLRERIPGAIQVAATAAAAYGAYAICARFEWSGIFAVIACAIVMREIERRRATVQMRDRVRTAWHGAATISNAVLFFLIGASVQMSHLWAHRALLVWTVGGVLGARAILAYGVLALVPRISGAWKTVVRMAGVRGALSLALAIGIPRAVAGASDVIDATFAVVVATILIGSITYERRIERLDLKTTEESTGVRR